MEDVTPDMRLRCTTRMHHFTSVTALLRRFVIALAYSNNSLKTRFWVAVFNLTADSRILTPFKLVVWNLFDFHCIFSILTRCLYIFCCFISTFGAELTSIVQQITDSSLIRGRAIVSQLPDFTGGAHQKRNMSTWLGKTYRVMNVNTVGSC